MDKAHLEVRHNDCPDNLVSVNRIGNCLQGTPRRRDPVLGRNHMKPIKGSTKSETVTFLETDPFPQARNSEAR